MLLELLLIGITALYYKPLKKTLIRCLDTRDDKVLSKKITRFLYVIAAVLLALACLSWVATLLYLLGALLQSITPGPEPFVLLPWFIGVVITTLLWFFADGLLNIIRKDEQVFF